MVLSVGVLLSHSVSRVNICVDFPRIEPINLVEGDAEWSSLVLEHPEGLEGLWLHTVHNIDNQHGQITKGRTTGSEVAEGLVTWCVDDEETWKLEVELIAFRLKMVCHIQVILEI